MEKSHRGSISGRHRSLAKIFLLRLSSYADAKDWDDLFHALTESLKYSSLDEMILLLHTAVPGPHEQRSEYVRPVTYDTQDEIRQQLLSMAPGAPRTGSAPDHQELRHAGIATGVRPDGDRGRQAQQKHVEMPQEKVNEGMEVEAFTPSEEYEQELDETQLDAAETTQERAP